MIPSDGDEWFLVSLRYIHKMIRGRRKASLVLKRVDEGSIYYITKLLVPRKGHYVVASYCFQRVHSLLPRDENSWPEDTRVLEFAREPGHMPQISPNMG